MNVNAVQLDSPTGPVAMQDTDGYGDFGYGAGPYGDPTGTAPAGSNLGLLGIAAGLGLLWVLSNNDNN